MQEKPQGAAIEWETISSGSGVGRLKGAGRKGLLEEVELEAPLGNGSSLSQQGREIVNSISSSDELLFRPTFPLKATAKALQKTFKILTISQIYDKRVINSQGKA